MSALRSISIAAGLLVLGTVALCARRKDRATDHPAILPVPSAERYHVPLGSSPSRGNADAKVTIVEWSDFQCPVSARLEATLARIAKVYGDDVRLVWKHRPLPFHAHAREAAEVAIAVQEKRGDAAFWRLHDLLFKNQAQLDRAALAKYGRQMGLSDIDVSSALDEHTHDSVILADVAQAQDLAARGWPVFYINGRPLSGEQPFEAFTKLIDEELANADQAIAHGTRLADLYEALTKPAKPPPAKVANLAATPCLAAALPVELPIGASPRRGSKTAKVVIVEFGDFQCPFCASLEPVLEKLEQEHGADLSVVWKNKPLSFHRNAMPAAKAAMAAAAQGKFWEIHDKLLGDPQHADELAFANYAAEFGLNSKQFARAMDDASVAAVINDDIALAAKAGVRATPSIFINGRLLRGAITQQCLETAVNAELSASSTVLTSNAHP